MEDSKTTERLPLCYYLNLPEDRVFKNNIRNEL